MATICLGLVVLAGPAEAGKGTINQQLAKWVHPPKGGCGYGMMLLATQYGRENGPKTASGERFDPDGLTAASLIYPMGTRLIVTNPHNGRSVSVRINDRGPYTNAKIDLSTGAARAIGMNSSSYVCAN